jgi:hypothetical protein
MVSLKIVRTLWALTTPDHLALASKMDGAARADTGAVGRPGQGWHVYFIRHSKPKVRRSRVECKVVMTYTVHTSPRALLLSPDSFMMHLL